MELMVCRYSICGDIRFMTIPLARHLLAYVWIISKKTNRISSGLRFLIRHGLFRVGGFVWVLRASTKTVLFPGVRMPYTTGPP